MGRKGGSASACVLALAVAAWACPARARAETGIEATRHNLSVTGPGPIKSLSETEVCVFCHTPHNASPAAPLWNHDLSAVKSYKLHRGASMVSRPEQPDGASRLCLGCHDGTIALGALRGRKGDVPLTGGIRALPGTSPSILGTDLSGSHPVSIVYDDRLAEETIARGHVPLVPPSQLHDPDVKLDDASKVQCTSCHDPHKDTHRATSGVPFWNKPTFMAVCTTCHDL